MSTDKAETLGWSVAESGDELKAELGTFLPPHAGVRNPIDLTVEGTGDEYAKVLCASLKTYDAALALYIGTPYLQALPIAQGLVQASEQTAKLIFSVLQVGADLAESLVYLKDHGIPNFVSGERAIAVLAAMEKYERFRVQNAKLPALSTNFPIAKADAQDKGFVLEPEAMQLLLHNGIAVPPFVFAQDEASALNACQTIGFPLVMKVVSPQIIHKSEVGGVILNIKNAEAATQAFQRLKTIADGKDFQGVVVRPMLDLGRELIIGLIRDPSFGPVVAFGLGGIYTEVLKDVVFRVAPLDQATALDMVQSIRSAQILYGQRGELPGDLEALVDTLVRFSQLPFRYPDIIEADLNPVFLYHKGLYVADTRVVVSEQS